MSLTNSHASARNILKLLIAQFAPVSCPFLFLESKYSPERPALKVPKSVSPLSSKKSNFRPLKITFQVTIMCSSSFETWSVKAKYSELNDRKHFKFFYSYLQRGHRNCFPKHVVEERNGWDGKTGNKTWAAAGLSWGNEKILVIKEEALYRPLENSPWKRLWTCRKANYVMTMMMTMMMMMIFYLFLSFQNILNLI